MHKIFRRILTLFRRLTGKIARLSQDNPAQRPSFRTWHIATLNALYAQACDPEEVRRSYLYQSCREIRDLLRTMNITGASFVRLGRHNDGGYVMVDQFSGVEAAYSFGIAQDASWDTAIADRGIDVYMYDHSISSIPAQHPRFRFSPIGLTGEGPSQKMRPLHELLSANGHENATNLLLKMDIEDAEWDVLVNADEELIARFSQIVIELHRIARPDPVKQKKIVDALSKLNRTHQAVHVHANTANPPTLLLDVMLPNTVEVTYVRRQDFQEMLIPDDRTFPTAIDQPTYARECDLLIGRLG